MLERPTNLRAHFQSRALRCLEYEAMEAVVHCGNEFARGADQLDRQVPKGRKSDLEDSRMLPQAESRIARSSIVRHRDL